MVPQLTPAVNLRFRNVTISGKIATGTTTLAKNLHRVLQWKYINAGVIQREYDRKHGVNENAHGALLRPDAHERTIEAMGKKILAEENQVIYEAWLSGFVGQDIPGVLKVLVTCSQDAIRIDRVANRDKVTIAQAKKYIRTREKENITKWKKIYGDYNFWDSKYYDVVIDTFSLGPMETLGRILDKLGYKNSE